MNTINNLAGPTLVRRQFLAEFLGGKNSKVVIEINVNHKGYEPINSLRLLGTVNIRDLDR